MTAMFKDARCAEIKSTLGNEAYDHMTISLVGDDGFKATLRIRTNDRAGFAFELGSVYRLAMAELPNPERPEVQASPPPA